MTWIETAIKELAEEESLELEEGKDLDDYVLSYDPHGDGKNVEIDGEDWTIYKNDGDAHEGAVEYVTETLTHEPELFVQEWLQGYLTMSDTDRRITAQEAADAYAYDLHDEDAIEAANMEEELERRVAPLQKAADAAAEAYRDYEGTDEDREQELADLDTEAEDALVEGTEKEQNMLGDTAREKVAEIEAEDHYDRLSDPIEYFSEYGWTAKDLLDRNIVSIDIEEAAEAAVNEDGVAHFLSGYDGNEVDLPSGAVAFRTN